MHEIIVNGKQSFLGKELPVIYGGFGENQKCICDKTIAEIHGMELKNIRARITDNIKRFKENIDFIDLKQRSCPTSTLNQKIVAYEASNNFLYDLGYSQMQISKAEHIYILSERGYAKLIKIMDSDLAWEIHDKLIDEYFQLREEKENLIERILNNPDFAIRTLIKFKEEKEQRQKLEQRNVFLEEKIEKDKLKVIFADSVSASNGLILIRELANIIQQNGINIGEKRLYKWLRENNYLIKRNGTDYNMPTQKSMDLKLFEIIESTTTTGNGSILINKTTKVTGKGQKYFINKFLKMKEEQIALQNL